ncbi:MAG TPA: hypothetical protein VNJ07_02950, partial [Chitinophagales bacterium]|nr:hypothetical protein [Chitinophagales bacterium]
MNVLHTTGLFIFISFSTQAQSVLKDSVVNLFMLKLHYSLQFPFADMQERFGINSALGAGIGGKVGKNIFLGIESSYLFGRNVKEDSLLYSITDENGFLIGGSGLYADYAFSEKGFTIQAQVGKIFSFKKPNVNSGLMAVAGAGYLQHKIGIAADK